MRVVVTGGAGFIGHNLVEELVKAGFEVLVIDNLTRASPRGIKVIKELNVPLKKIDVTNYSELINALTSYRPDAVVHAAALIDVAESVEHPETYAHVNVEGTACVAKAALKAGTSKLIYLSSAAVYGKPVKLPISEEHPTNPISPYGATKLGGELIIKALKASAGGPNYVILRLFNVYGPGQSVSNPYAGVITKFINAALRGEDLVIYGDGEQTRDFIHVKDVADAIIKSISTKVRNIELNIGSGKEMSINKLAEIVLKETGSKSEIRYTSPRLGDIKHSVASIEKATKLLKWRPKIDLSSGLKDIVSSIKKSAGAKG